MVPVLYPLIPPAVSVPLSLPKFKLAKSDTLAPTRIIQTVRFLPMIDIVSFAGREYFLQPVHLFWTVRSRDVQDAMKFWGDTCPRTVGILKLLLI